MSNYELLERKLWNNLRQELKRYKKDFNTTDIEMTLGLKISRQSLSRFLNEDKYGLPIGGIDLVRLWNYMTDPNNPRYSKLSPHIRKTREESKDVECQWLLARGGYSYETYYNLKQRLELDKGGDSMGFDKQSEDYFLRVRQRLWKRSSETDQFSLDRLGGWKKQHQNFYENEKLTDKKNPQLRSILDKTYLMLAEKLNIFSLSRTHDKFYRRELDSLYDCLYKECTKKHNYSFLGYGNAFSLLTASVVHCSFEDLTIPFADSNFSSEILNQKIINVKNKVEEQLRNNSVKSFRLTNFNIPKVSQANIQVRFPAVSSDFGQANGKTITLVYSSDGTQLTNLSNAIGKCLGSSGKLTSLSTEFEGLSGSQDCLVKASSAFEETENLETDNIRHTSSWIDVNTINSVAQSSLHAIRDWLLKPIEPVDTETKLVDSLTAFTSSQQYRDFCIEFNGLQAKVYELNKYVSNYQFTNTDFFQELSETLENVTQLKDKYVIAAQKYPTVAMSSFNENLQYYECLLIWMRERYRNIRGSVRNQPETIAYRTENEDIKVKVHPLIQILSNIEDKVYKFCHDGDDPSRYSEKNSTDADQWLKDLHDYIHSDQYAVHGHMKGSLELDSYFVASEIYGRIGRLSMYTHGNEGEEKLRKAIENLLAAAYCCTKIGYRTRIAHWLTNAAIAYSKLQNTEQNRNIAYELITEAYNTIKTSVEYPQVDIDEDKYPRVGESKLLLDQRYYQSIFAENNLGFGILKMQEAQALEKEKAVPTEDSYLKACEYFVDALEGATYLSFRRVVSDSLIGLEECLSNIKNNEEHRQGISQKLGKVKDRLKPPSLLDKRRSSSQDDNVDIDKAIQQINNDSTLELKVKKYLVKLVKEKNAETKDTSQHNDAISLKLDLVDNMLGVFEEFLSAPTDVDIREFLKEQNWENKLTRIWSYHKRSLIPKVRVDID